MLSSWITISATLWALAGLIGGLVLGIAAPHDALVTASLPTCTTLGTLWINALRMTIVPLVSALLISGITGSIEQARVSRVAGRAVALYMALLLASAVLAALMVPALLHIFPIEGRAAAALRTATSGVPQAIPPQASVADMLLAAIPTNPLAAAAQDAMLPLIIFVSLFALALTRLPKAQAAPMTHFFRTIADAMLLIVGWVLKLAPLAIFCLALQLGARAGEGAISALIHYVLIVSSTGVALLLLAYPLAVLMGRVAMGAFLRALAPAQIVAFSTQSSIAALPAMISGCEQIGVPEHVYGVSLPVAVSVFRVTSPAMNLAVTLYTAAWLGIPLTMPSMVAGIIVAGLASLGTVSLPNQVTFLSSIAPIALAMGVPVAPIALFIAVEMLPDIVRTVGNVTMDVAAARILARWDNVRETYH
ncbi:MAG: cation:dicarboxylase symporter family transporter [Alphaproteobacteria bacterium]|nr:cation:dicarboxylase symporter family transporter [Alphaproteobacteria bacterium]MDE2341292.1 cation:dicarboxylase symporter family transporter [Alphaproteobacteria bacterium]